jgi:hypothetical protein
MIAIEEYKQLGATYRNTKIQHSLKFLQRILDEASDLKQEEDEALRYDISILRELATTIVFVSTGTIIATTSLNDGAIILEDAIQETRNQSHTQEQLVKLCGNDGYWTCSQSSQTVHLPPAYQISHIAANKILDAS